MSVFDCLDPADYSLPDDLRADLMSPALVVWLDKVRANVARVIDAVGGDPDRWRPHVKTTKIPAVWRVLIASGVRHFKCATTREAQHLLLTLDQEGVDGDVLVSHPLVGPNLRRLGELAARHPRCRLSVLVEHPVVVLELPARVGAYVDLNPGMNRTGVPLEDTSRILEVARATGDRLRGLHFYDGHHHQLDLAARRAAVHAGYDRLVELIEGLKREGMVIGEVITAGTPAFLSATQHWPLRRLESTLHRVSPGTVVFHDARSQEQNPQFELDPAALVFSRVISRPTPDSITCDAGSKSIAAEAGTPVAIALGRPDLEALEPSEEHLPFRVDGRRPVLGEELLLIPRHVCPTVNLAEEALLMDGEDLVGVVPVSARAHDVCPDRTYGTRSFS